jgi:hypothetical protein
VEEKRRKFAGFQCSVFSGEENWDAGTVGGEREKCRVSSGRGQKRKRVNREGAKVAKGRRGRWGTGFR